MSEESVESIFQHACEGAAESIGSTRTDWQRVVDAIRELRRERDEARRLLEEAREQKPVADVSILRNASGTSVIYALNANSAAALTQGMPLYAAPVPAQPSHFRARLIELCQPWTPANLDRIESCEEIVRAVAEGPHSQPAAVPEAVAKASKLLRAHNEWRRGADNTAAYTAAGLGDAIDTVCNHIEEVLGMVTMQIIPADVMNDAARYQWLKQRSPFGNRAPHIEQYPFQSGFDKVKLPHFTVVGLDEAIDAAIDAALLSAADTEVKK